jgi:hypothetical protein
MLAGKAADPIAGVLGSAVGFTATEGELAGAGRGDEPASAGWRPGNFAGELPSTTTSVKAAAAATTTATAPATPAAARRCRFAARRTRDCASGHGASDQRGSRSSSRSRSSSFTGSSLVDAFWIK